MIRYVVAAPLVLFLVLLVVGGLTGRVRVRSCCSPPDLASDSVRRETSPAAGEMRSPRRAAPHRAAPHRVVAGGGRAKPGGSFTP